MKKVKAMAAIMAATAVISTGAGAIPTFAADAAPSAQTVQAMEKFVQSTDVQSEVRATASEADTTYSEFDFGSLTTVGQTGNLTGEAYKVDLSKTSMANNSLDSGSTVKLTDNGYEFTIKTKSQTYLGKTAKPKSATVTYYEVNDNGDYIEQTMDCVVADDGSQITFTLPDGAAGLEPTTTSIPDSYKNMLKVNMTTTLKDSWVSGIFPEPMTAPTFFYLFNVASVQ